MEYTEDQIDKQDAIIAFCVATNPKEFNYNKALEEASEFSEALLKFQTKHPDNPKRPTKYDILTEYADFVYRGIIAVRSLYLGDPEYDQIEEIIGEHIHTKLMKLIEYKEAGKYKGGL